MLDLGVCPFPLSCIHTGYQHEWIICQNLGWAFADVLLVIPTETPDSIRPDIEAVIMVTSSLLVVATLCICVIG